jgi:hypothetical protein
MHEWCLDPEDDVEDMKVVKLANPASWHTLKKLEWRRTSPTATPSPWHWLRFACGIWTEGEEPWLEPAEWDRLSDSTANIEVGASVWLGVSIGASQARTDIIILERDEDRVTVNLRAIVPGPNQERVSLADSEAAVRALVARYSVLGVVYISLGFQHSAEVLEEEGVPMIEYPMKPARVELASQTLEAVVMEGRLAHDNDSALRAQVLAGVKKSTEGGWRFIVDMKGASALLALAAVCQLALNEEPVEDMGVVFF